jgi:hypothetical protein
VRYFCILQLELTEQSMNEVRSANTEIGKTTEYSFLRNFTEVKREPPLASQPSRLATLKGN